MFQKKLNCLKRFCRNFTTFVPGCRVGETTGVTYNIKSDSLIIRMFIKIEKFHFTWIKLNKGLILILNKDVRNKFYKTYL